MKPVHRGAMLTLFVCLAALSCRNALPTESGDRLPPVAAAKTLATLDCVADVSARQVTCEFPQPKPGDARLDLTLGQVQVKMASTNLLSDTVAQTFAFDATAQNLLAEPIGTPDRFTVTGLKVFFHSGPTVTAYKVPGDTAKVTVANADSTGNFTGANQPYHFYNQILQPQEVSAKKRWVFNVPRTVDRFSFSVKVLAAAPSETPVPATAPDSVPAWVEAESNWLDDTPCFGRAVGNVLNVAFLSTTTQEERQAAVDYVGGTVVGGMYGGPDGTYYVRIADVPSGAKLCDAISRLSALPQVEFAHPILPALPPLSLSPQDGPTFTGWRVDAYQADGENWALEAISAPLAWGCETGRDDVKIAVVDMNHVRAPDLWANATHIDSVGLFPGSPANMHGTRVAAIASAQGDNNSGMTGVMWNADLRLYDYRRNIQRQVVPPSVNGQTRRLVEAAQAGAKVINFSFGYTWHEVKGRLPLTVPDSVAHDHNLMSVYREKLRAAVRQIEQSTDALVVIGAGNTPLDAYWSGYAQVKADYPERVIVVAASNQASQLWTRDSNIGSGRNITDSFVEVAAPGENVHTFADSITLGRGDGTSLAAPHVTGLVGLLLSFDPRLSPAEAKRLVLVGAQRGGKMAGGIPVINAHESLKAAAERPGAPLCGNRVWHADGKLRVQRGEGVGSSVEDVITTNASFVDDVQIPHGGKRVFFYSPAARNDVQYVWNSGSWTAQALSSTTRDSVWDGIAPSLRSRWGASHDNDAYVQTAVRSGGVELTRYSKGVDDMWTSTVLATLPEPHGVNGTYECTRLDSTYNAQLQRNEPVCKARGLQGTERFTATSDRVGYSPRGERVLLGVTTQTASHSVDMAWYRCLDRHTEKSDSSTYSSVELCRSTSFTQGTPASKLYSVAIPATSGQSAAVSVLATQAGVSWQWVAFADGRDEFTLQSRTGPSACITEFRRASAPTQVVYSVPVCGLGEATFSPARIAGGTTLAPSARRPPPPVVTGWRSTFGLRRLLPRWSGL